MGIQQSPLAVWRASLPVPQPSASRQPADDPVIFVSNARTRLVQHFNALWSPSRPASASHARPRHHGDATPQQRPWSWSYPCIRRRRVAAIPLTVTRRCLSRGHQAADLREHCWRHAKQQCHVCSSDGPGAFRLSQSEHTWRYDSFNTQGRHKAARQSQSSGWQGTVGGAAAQHGSCQPVTARSGNVKC